MEPQATSRTAAAAREAAYRRLALTILGLDVPTLDAELHAQRLGYVRVVSRVDSRPSRPN
jgi:hypothetical protein